ncbi:phage tail protein [Sphingobacterium tabacisoli]|nr:tail fiber protein [Sphingobacterium tabacisoli]
MAEIRMFAANFAPKNWAYCSGQLLAINQNQALFSLLGTTFGGNGVTTVALPDFRGRTPVGTGTNNLGLTFVLGNTIGSESVTLTMTNLPPHNHPTSIAGNIGVKARNAIANQSSPSSSSYLAIPARSAGRAKTKVKGFDTASGTVTLHANTVQATADTQSTGANQPHNNMQPSLGINYIICLYGIYPSRN